MSREHLLCTEYLVGKDVYRGEINLRTPVWKCSNYKLLARESVRRGTLQLRPDLTPLGLRKGNHNILRRYTSNV